MIYKIIPTKEFEKDFKKLDKFFQTQIKNKFEEVAKNPGRFKHLHFDLSKFSRIRIGKLRVIFRYDIQRQEVYLEKIVFGHDY